MTQLNSSCVYTLPQWFKSNDKIELQALADWFEEDGDLITAEIIRNCLVSGIFNPLVEDGYYTWECYTEFVDQTMYFEKNKIAVRKKDIAKQKYKNILYIKNNGIYTVGFITYKEAIEFFIDVNFVYRDWI